MKNIDLFIDYATTLENMPFQDSNNPERKPYSTEIEPAEVSLSPDAIAIVAALLTLADVIASK